MKLFHVMRDISFAQAKNCLLFIHVGTTGYALCPKWFKGDCWLRIEMDTPSQRLRFRCGRIRFSLRTNAIGHGGYRQRWLTKLGL